MTDYLKELLEGAETLLEQVLRAEYRAFVREEGELPLKTEDRNRKKYWVDNLETSINWTPDGVYKEGSGRFSGGEEAADGESAAKGLPVPEGGQAEKSALEEELERMDRISAGFGYGGIGAGREPGRDSPAPARAGAGAVFPGGFRELYGGGAAGSGTLGEEAPAGEALDWAERADRVFRRDSRRYDGGFRLY